jgi:hypothetical protein
MQVSTIAELDTHAVIGGGQAQAFGMSDSAEFFTVLSDTLYRDKKRAVIREVICNAHDAHVMVGKTDVPLEITLTENELTIKDFGPGIAKDKIGPVYCVYGASTKVKDATQTGGFGLGCKAPFAYSDHFTVTSCIDGFRTLWAISRGGAATDGKPDFRAMVSVPSTETGITVSIPLKNSGDVQVFTTLIKEVVRNGGMLAKLNGERLERFDYTEARKNGFAIAPRGSYSSFRESRVYLLYATVLYPVLTTDEEIMAKVDDFDRLIESNGRAVLIAKPNTIGVQPSREGLSYSELTTGTLHSLLDQAIATLKATGPLIARKIVRAHARSIMKDRYALTVSSPTSSNTPCRELLSDPKVIAERAVRERLSNYLPDAQRRKIAISEMAKKFRDDRRIFRRGAADYRFNLERERFDHSRRLILRLASKADVLDNVVLFTKDSGYVRWVGSKIDEKRFNRPMIQRLIIGPSRKLVDEQLRKEFDSKSRSAYDDQSSDIIPALILNAPSEKLLMSVLEIAEALKIPTTLLEFPKRKKSAKIGDLFTGLLDLTHNSKNYTWRAVKANVSEPKHYIRAYGTQERLELGFARYSEDKSAFKKIENMFPGTVVAWTVKQEAKLKSKGIPNLDVVIAKELKALENSREVQYATMMQGGHFISSQEYRHSISGKIAVMCSQSLTMCKFFFPDRAKLGDKTDRLHKLCEIAGMIGNERGYACPNGTIARETMKNIATKAKITFKDMIMDSRAVEKKFDYMRLIANINYSPADDEQILGLIKFLAKQAKAASSANTETQKEAA